MNILKPITDSCKSFCAECAQRNEQQYTIGTLLEKMLRNLLLSLKSSGHKWQMQEKANLNPKWESEDQHEEVKVWII